MENFTPPKAETDHLAHVKALRKAADFFGTLSLIHRDEERWATEAASIGINIYNPMPWKYQLEVAAREKP